MFTKTPVDDNHKLNEVIDEALAYMSTAKIDDEDYDAMLKRLERLSALRRTPVDRRPSPDVLVAAAANILGVILIVGHERAHVLTSKAVMFLKQMK